MIKNFNNFIQESKNPTKILQSLTDLVQKRFKNIDENSHIFCNILHKYFNFDKFLFVSKLEFSDNVKDIRHVYVYLNGRYLDGDGFHTKTDIMDKFKISNETFNDLAFISDLGKLHEYSKIVITTLSEKQTKEIEHLVKQFSQML